MEMESLSHYISQSSKKRVFPGGTSTCMEAEVVAIPPASNYGSVSNSLKQKEAFSPEIIDVDLDGDCGDVMLIDEKIVLSVKGKEIVNYLLCDPCDEMNEGSVDDAQSLKNYDSGSDNLGHDSSYGDDKFLDMYYEDIMYDDEYAYLQSQFDNLDLPTGIEAPIPWFTNNINSSSTTDTSPSPSPCINSVATSKSKLGDVGYPSGSDSSRLSSSLQSVVKARKKMSTPGTLLSAAHAQTSSTIWSSPDSAQSKTGSNTGSGFFNLNSKLKSSGNFSSGEKPPKSLRSLSSRLRNKSFVAGATSSNSLQKDYPNSAIYKQLGGNDDWQAVFNATGVTQYNDLHNFPKETAFNPLSLYDKSSAGTIEISPQSSSTRVDYGNPEEIMNRFQFFKNFDTVEDISDHCYHRNSSVKQPSKEWAKKIQDEWRILEKDLPDTIYVRGCESRMDLLRAVIVGAEGTPYHDGLFFFDVFFPSSYPDIPPTVHYHSGGLRINPNLYNCGKVCLSLLNTWSGNEKEKWIPGVSTMLQVLVSIQGLILNANPYFNEPGYAAMSGTAIGEKCSLEYNERTFILSLKTMIYNIRRPPKYFEDIVAGHFCTRAHDILMACQSYIDGAQVGCLVKWGGVQDVVEGHKSCSQGFRFDVATFINMLVDEFKQVGLASTECKKFLPLAHKANGP